MWVPPEIKEPFILHHPTKKSIGYYGAVRIRDGKYIYSREDDKFNGATFFSFMKKLHRIGKRSGRKVGVILDNASYHHAKVHIKWREKNKDTLLLEFMPAYSPELNPIERIWKQTRRKGTHNRYFKSINELITAVEGVFINWQIRSDDLKTLCAIN